MCPSSGQEFIYPQQHPRWHELTSEQQGVLLTVMLPMRWKGTPARIAKMIDDIFYFRRCPPVNAQERQELQR
jgi:hypothetical protein